MGVHSGFCFVILVIYVLNLSANLCYGGVTSSFVRKVEKTIDMPLDADVFNVPPGYNAPQQVHITQGDHVGRGVIVSWITMDEPGSSTVLYWTENANQTEKARGKVTTYRFFNYTSGYIHHCTINNLKVGLAKLIGLDGETNVQASLDSLFLKYALFFPSA